MLRTGLKSLLIDLNLIEGQSVILFNQKNWQVHISADTKKKLGIIKPSAFYVFNQQPYILFFDLTEDRNPNREEEIHKQVWSFDQSPLIFVIKDSDIEIFNAFSYNKKTSRLEKIKLKDDEKITDVFSFWNLQSGSTWKWLQENYYKKTIQDKRVNQKLFENIKFVRETLANPNNESPIEEDEANILILRLIFIRYLIDRGVRLDETYINGATFLEKRKSFIDLIEKPKKLNIFFEWLNSKFNGVLFKDIKVQLSKEKAIQLSLIFNGELPEKGSLFDGTDLYFEIFDFSIIPVELISGIYEALIDEETKRLHSAVYTPSFLVEYILTNTVDKFFQEKANKYQSECKVFDPSVGSGIFLVQAFRRMVDREIELTGQDKINKNRLREIAKNNLFGIDVNKQALKITCFSIYIAMLDYIDPKSILPLFHFPNLIDNNLFDANFFDTKDDFNAAIKARGMDFILGNPPWKSDKDQIHINWLRDNNKTVGRFEIAQSFLLRSKDFMHAKTISALIVTSTIFYNISAPTKKFKQVFLKEFAIDRFFDLSAVRRLIFEEKNSPCSIVFYKLSVGENYLANVIKHLSIKSNLFLKYYKTLVIEKFDQKEIQQKHFIENDWMFKVALYGNTLDFTLLKKIICQGRPLSTLIDNKSIFKGGGIHKGTKDKYEPFFPILNKPLIENSNINKYYSVSTSEKTINESDIYIKSGRASGMFVGKQILIKEQAKNESELVFSLTNKEYVFRSGVFTIASKENPSQIELLFSFLITSLFEYFVYMTSGSWGVSTRPQIRLDEEYLLFPYKHPNDKIKKQLIDLVNDFLKPYQEFYKTFNLGEPQRNEIVFDKINSIVEGLYNIRGYENDLIDYVLNISRYQFQESKQQQIIRKVHNDIDMLEKYADIFLEEFKDVYIGEFLQVEIFSLDHFIAMNFNFSHEKPKDKIYVNTDVTIESEVFRLIANSISISEVAKDLYIQKDIKGFDKNSFYIIKPNEYKCWHRAMAWYDVADIKKTIENAEIEYLKNSFNGE